MIRAVPFIALITMAVACTAPPPDAQSSEFAQTIRGTTIPASLSAGEAAFEASCMSCHGERALGTDRGPPLIDVIYEPSHHADISFLLAAQRGVRAHHWKFGDMPPVPEVDAAEVREIVGYVRFLQEQVGIR